MSTSPNLLITDISASQNQKEVTHNAAIHELDLALTNLLSTAMGDANVTLTTGEGNQALANMVFIFTGANTAARNVIVPTNKKLYIVSNATTGGFKITVKTSSGTGIDVQPTDGYRLLYCDGTNVVAVAGGGSSGIGGVSSKSADYTITSADNGTAVVLSTGSHTFTPPAPATTIAVFVLNIGTGTLTLSRNSKNINGAASDASFAQFEGGLLLSDGTNYFLFTGKSGSGSSTLGSLSDVSLSSPAGGDALVFDSGSSAWKNTKRLAAICFVIDGGGSVPATGVYGQISIPFACTVVGWNLTGDASGSAVVDVLRSTGGGFPTTSSIAGTDKPTLSSAQRAHDVALSGWGSASLAQYDELQVNLSSVTTCKRLNLTLYVQVG